MGERSSILRVFLGTLVVLGAVVVLGGVGGAVLLYVGVQQVQESAKGDVTRLSMARAGQQVAIHELKGGQITDLDVIFPVGVPTDAWDRPFVLVVPGPGDRTFDLVSLGADGRPGGSGNDADLKYSEI